MPDPISVVSPVLMALARVTNDVMLKVVSSLSIDGVSFSRPFTIAFFLLIGTSFVWFLERPRPHPRVFVLLLGPAVFRTASELLMTYAIVFGRASVCFVIRHSLTMFLPMALAGKRPRGYQLLAVGIAVCATAIGFAAHLPDWRIPLLVVIAQFLKAGQLAIENCIRDDVDVCECLGISAEAAWGAILTALIGFPLAAIIPGADESSLPGGSLENVRLSFSTIVSSFKLVLGVLVLSFAAFLSGGAALMITGARARITFVWVDLAVSLVAWIVLLAIGKSVGEVISWNSLAQFVSFLLFAFASLVYNQVIRFPCFTYSEWAHISDQDVPLELMDAQ